ncbi:MAG: tetratricopeptide repeat protein [Armatimonadetes bacterium]|nr:tetratricopeptide repeat protein [Armatimonadota bacterium]
MKNRNELPHPPPALISIVLILNLLWALCGTNPAMGAEIKVGPVMETPKAGEGQVPAPETQGSYELFMKKGRAFYELKRWDPAVIEIKEALRLRPDSVEAYELFAKVLVEMKNWAAAIPTYQKLVELAPTNVEHINTLIKICDAYNMPIQEGGAITALLKVQPTNTRAMRRLAKLYEEIGQPDKIISTYEEIVKLEPKNLEDLKTLANHYERNGKLKKAASIYEKMLALEPPGKESIDVLALAKFYEDRRKWIYVLAKFYKDTNQYKKMKETYAKLPAGEQASLLLKEELALALFEEGDEHLGEDRLGSAHKRYRLALAENPALEEARDRLRFVESIDSFATLESESSSVGLNRFDIKRGAITHALKGDDIIVGIAYQLLDVNSPAYDIYPQASATSSVAKVTAAYRFGKSWTAAIANGGNTVHEETLSWKSPTVSASIGYKGDYVYETPFALLSDLRYNGITAKGEYTHRRRLHFSGDWSKNRYTDGTIETIYDYGATYQLWEKPEKYFFAVDYFATRKVNGQTINPQVRFSPSDYYVWSRGVTWNHTPSKRLFYQGQYFWTTDNQGVNTDSWSVSATYQIAKQTSLSLDYSRGTAPAGTIRPGTPTGEDFRVLTTLKTRF